MVTKVSHLLFGLILLLMVLFPPWHAPINREAGVDREVDLGNAFILSNPQPRIAQVNPFKLGTRLLIVVVGYGALIAIFNRRSR